MTAGKVPRARRTRASTAKPAATDDTRVRILAAAGEVFAEVGYYAATVRQICSRADANIALVNYHFGDKLGLYSEVLRELKSCTKMDEFRTALDQDAPPETILRNVVRLRLQAAFGSDRQSWRVRIMCHELAQPSPAMARMVNEVSRPIYKRMLELIGSFTGLPPDDEKNVLCVNSVFGQVFLYILGGPLIQRLWPEMKMTTENVDHIADHIADFSLAYLKEIGARHFQTAATRNGSKRQ